MRGVEVAPRDVVAAALPDPATLGERMSGRTCAGTWVTGTGKDGQPRSTYLYHVVDNETTMREYGSQAVVWQTAINPAVALELLDRGEWKGAGVLGPEAFPPAPFLELLPSTARRTGRSSCSGDPAACSSHGARASARAPWPLRLRLRSRRAPASVRSAAAARAGRAAPFRSCARRTL